MYFNFWKTNNFPKKAINFKMHSVALAYHMICSEHNYNTHQKRCPQSQVTGT